MSDPVSEPTGVVPEVRLQLADFVDGDPPLPAAVLVVVDGPDRGRVLTVADLPATIGRTDQTDLVLADDTVSRSHARFEDRDGVLEVTDLGSSNGTTLHGNPIVGSIGLRDGDLVGFGGSVVLVKLVG